MANKNWPFGLAPVRMLDGQAPYTTRWPLRQANQTTKQTTNIYKGQVVLFNNTGQYAKASGVTNPGGGEILGVAAEHYFGSVINATKTDIAVWEGDKHIFAIQCDNATTTSTVKALRGKTASIVSPDTGSTITGLSSSQLDWSSGTTTNDKPLVILGGTGEIGESETGANLKVLVRFNFGHVYTQQATPIFS